MGGRHRSSWVARLASPTPTEILVGWLVLAIAFGVVGWAVTRGPLCRGAQGLTVHAEPAVAPVLRAAADRMRAKRAAVDEVCIHATVLDRQPAGVAAQVTAAASGDASSQNLPDVWVPDSTLWLDLVRARRQARLEVPPASVSLAVSPIVVAMTPPVARRIAAGGTIAWARLLDEISGRDPLTFGMPDPASSATGLAALHGLHEVLEDRRAPPAALAETCRALAANAAPTVSELTGQVAAPRFGTALQAFPADEAAVWRFNRKHPGVPLVAVYPADGTMRLDYPYAVLPRAAADPGKSEAAATLFAEATGPDGNAALFAAGLRLADGTPGPPASAVSGVSWSAPPAMDRPPPAEAVRLIRQWAEAKSP